jgi:hypothetical protein
LLFVTLSCASELGSHRAFALRDEHKAAPGFDESWLIGSASQCEANTGFFYFRFISSITSIDIVLQLT